MDEKIHRWSTKRRLMDETVPHSSMRRFLVAVIMWPKLFATYRRFIYCLPMGGMVKEIINTWHTPIG
jgi:hypothetical protein